MKTLVVHFKKEPYDVYVGRPSKWGNPYSHKEGTLAEFKTKNRREAVDKFEKYLIGNKDLMKDLPSLKGKVLGCWCAPSLCHASILIKYANKAEPLF